MMLRAARKLKITRLLRQISDRFQKPLYQLYFQNCHITPGEIQIYGQYKGKPNFSLTILKNEVPLPKGEFQLVYCGKRPDFLVKIKDLQYSPEDRYTFIINGRAVHEMVQLRDPLTNKLSFAQCVIATMVKNEKNKIVEWINYHFLLGFEKIIIYLNNSTDGTAQIIQSLGNPNVIAVPFNYTAFPGWRWNNVQRIQLSLNSNILRNFSNWVCFIDVDEFIYICDHSVRREPLIQSYIDDFHCRYPNAAALRINSYFFTNEQVSYRPNQDVVANCCLRTVTTGYSKIIVNSEYLSEFTVTPHKFNADVTASTDSIYYGHYWIKGLRNPQGEFHACQDIANFVSERIN